MLKFKQEELKSYVENTTDRPEKKETTCLLFFLCKLHRNYDLSLEDGFKITEATNSDGCKDVG